MLSTIQKKLDVPIQMTMPISFPSPYYYDSFDRLIQTTHQIAQVTGECMIQAQVVEMPDDTDEFFLAIALNLLFKKREFEKYYALLFGSSTDIFMKKLSDLINNYEKNQDIAPLAFGVMSLIATRLKPRMINFIRDYQDPLRRLGFYPILLKQQLSLPSTEPKIELIKLVRLFLTHPICIHSRPMDEGETIYMSRRELFSSAWDIDMLKSPIHLLKSHTATGLERLMYLRYF